ncbi:MAG: FAD dependent [Desulfovibrionaceae bacterium]|nr:MAG: FAD dependent [Desulfovibrionaceae bacterium]
MGMTHGTIAGMLLKDMILGKENPWEKLYDPSRITLSASGNYARETLNMMAQYRDWFTAGDVESVDAIAKGNGAILRRGVKKIAAFRDETGKIHEMSAVCPHLGGIVRWNPTEKTWDCPCHGSRFKETGAVMMGPANTNLTPIEED